MLFDVPTSIESTVSDDQAAQTIAKLLSDMVSEEGNRKAREFVQIIREKYRSLHAEGNVVTYSDLVQFAVAHDISLLQKYI